MDERLGHADFTPDCPEGFKPVTFMLATDDHRIRLEKSREGDRFAQAGVRWGAELVCLQRKPVAGGELLLLHKASASVYTTSMTGRSTEPALEVVGLWDGRWFKLIAACQPGRKVYTARRAMLAYFNQEAIHENQDR